MFINVSQYKENESLCTKNESNIYGVLLITYTSTDVKIYA